MGAEQGKYRELPHQVSYAQKTLNHDIGNKLMFDILLLCILRHNFIYSTLYRKFKTFTQYFDIFICYIYANKTSEPELLNLSFWTWTCEPDFWTWTGRSQLRSQSFSSGSQPAAKGQLCCQCQQKCEGILSILGRGNRHQTGDWHTEVCGFGETSGWSTYCCWTVGFE